MPELTVKNLISWISAGAMMFGGIVPFVPQYYEIKRTGNAEGFSTFVCLTLLIANILRILFWFGKHFEFPLLAQSMIMLIAMMVMMHLCVMTKNKAELVTSKSRIFLDGKHKKAESSASSYRPVSLPGRFFLDFNTKYFWKWTDYFSYVQFIAAFAITLSMVTYVFISSWLYVETIGFLAVFCEAMLGTPQFYRNYQNQSTHGMSKKMVAFWTMGDIFKTVYFILRQAPFQFWVCGTFQVCIDLAIFGQVLYYGLHHHRVPKAATR